MNSFFPIIACSFVLGAALGAANQALTAKFAVWPRVLAWFNLPALSMCPIVVLLSPTGKGYLSALAAGMIYFFTFELGTRLIKQGLPKANAVFRLLAQVACSALICALGGVAAVFIAKLFV